MQFCLMGNSCLLISVEQMEESPHLTRDQFYAAAAAATSVYLLLFICKLSSGRGGVTSQT